MRPPAAYFAMCVMFYWYASHSAYSISPSFNNVNLCLFLFPFEGNLSLGEHKKGADHGVGA